MTLVCNAQQRVSENCVYCNIHHFILLLAGNQIKHKGLYNMVFTSQTHLFILYLMYHSANCEIRR